MSIGKKLKLLREHKKLSQEQLAQQIGVTKTMVCKYETDSRQPSFKVLRKLCHTLGVSADYLLDVNIEKSVMSLHDLDEEQTAAVLTILRSFRQNNDQL